MLIEKVCLLLTIDFPRLNLRCSWKNCNLTLGIYDTATEDAETANYKMKKTSASFGASC